MKMKPPSGPKKQTQNKPNSNPISSKAKMNLKSLAGKSGHTLKNERPRKKVDSF